MTEKRRLPMGRHRVVAERHLLMGKRRLLAGLLLLSTLAVAVLVVALLPTVAGSAAVDLPRAQERAAEGNRAYESGRWDDAIEAWQQAIDAGLDHEVILYNLGNAWFKKGRIGKAILFYRRALRMNPRDGAARSNLQRAMAQVRDEALQPLSLPIFLRPLEWIYGRLSLNEWTMVSLALWWLLILVAALRGWWRPSWLQGRGLLWVFGLLLLFAVSMTALHLRRERLRHEAVVVAEEVEVRSGPGDDYRLSFKIHEGLPVFIDRREGDWTRIHLGGELVGWVPSDRIEEI